MKSFLTTASLTLLTVAGCSQKNTDATTTAAGTKSFEILNCVDADSRKDLRTMKLNVQVDSNNNIVAIDGTTVRDTVDSANGQTENEKGYFMGSLEGLKHESTGGSDSETTDTYILKDLKFKTTTIKSNDPIKYVGLNDMVSIKIKREMFEFGTNQAETITSLTLSYVDTYPIAKPNQEPKPERSMGVVGCQVKNKALFEQLLKK